LEVDIVKATLVHNPQNITSLTRREWGLIMTISGEDIHLLFGSFLANYKTKSTSSRSSFLQKSTTAISDAANSLEKKLQTDGQITKEWK
jgi:hypothetical protein